MTGRWAMPPWRVQACGTCGGLLASDGAWIAHDTGCPELPARVRIEDVRGHSVEIIAHELQAQHDRREVNLQNRRANKTFPVREPVGPHPRYVEAFREGVERLRREDEEKYRQWCDLQAALRQLEALGLESWPGPGRARLP